MQSKIENVLLHNYDVNMFETYTIIVEYENIRS